jgi:hypothetical protein
MSEVIPVSVEWLTLREQADARSRSAELALAAAGLLSPGPLVVHDLGSGTGSMMRWLAPLLPGPQTWVLHDWNPALLQRAVSDAGQDAADGDVEVRTSVTHAEGLRRRDLAGASLITGSALLDVLTRREIATIVRACVATGAPTLFSLSVTGRVRLDPEDARDRVLEAAFNDHQRRVTDRRRLLGPDGIDTAAELFRSAGWSVRIADSPWRLDSSDRTLIEEWLDGWIAAAIEERPALGEWAPEYARMRAAEVADGGLSVDVDHRDLLAWP